MLFLFRLVFVTFFLIFTNLIFPAFKVGGKYQIVFAATIAAFLLQLSQTLLQHRFPVQERALICANVMLISLLLVKLLFVGVRLTFAGILLSYLGVSLMETLLPEENERILVKK